MDCPMLTQLPPAVPFFGASVQRRLERIPKENVPANSSAEQELVASPYGQLLTEPLLKLESLMVPHLEAMDWW